MAVEMGSGNETFEGDEDRPMEIALFRGTEHGEAF
jgi:hypothetical protein